jgi:hypothetical protein
MANQIKPLNAQTPALPLKRNKIGARLCAKHQPQHVEKLCDIRRIPADWFCEAAAAGLRLSRAPGAVSVTPQSSPALFH